MPENFLMVTFWSYNSTGIHESPKCPKWGFGKFHFVISFRSEITKWNHEMKLLKRDIWIVFRGMLRISFHYIYGNEIIAIFEFPQMLNSHLITWDRGTMAMDWGPNPLLPRKKRCSTCNALLMTDGTCRIFAFPIGTYPLRVSTLNLGIGMPGGNAICWGSEKKIEVVKKRRDLKCKMC